MWGHQPERNAPCHGCQERKGFPEGYNTQQSVLHFWPVIGACPACIVNFIKAHRCALHWHTRTYICPHVCLLNLHTWVTHWSYLESACSQAHVFAHTYTPSPPPHPAHTASYEKDEMVIPGCTKKVFTACWLQRNRGETGCSLYLCFSRSGLLNFHAHNWGEEWGSTNHSHVLILKGVLQPGKHFLKGSGL